MAFYTTIRFQALSGVWLGVAATIPYLLFPGIAIQAGAQMPDGQIPASAPPQKPFSPLVSQWQPDEFQKAMILGTTVPNEMPLPLIPLEPLSSPDSPQQSPPVIEEIPPIFRKPLPIISPAEPPSKNP
ncbi:MAG: hypothetical protein WCA35_12230 [Kovacikia sp.]